VGYKGDFTTPVSDKSSRSAKPIFAVGSPEQKLVDQFLSHFPADQARKLAEDLRTRRTTLVAQDPDRQRELDGIYAALDRIPQMPRSGGSVPPVAFQYKPGPAEAALIEDFIASLPSDMSKEQAAKLRQAVLTSGGQLGSDNPVMMKKLNKIYEARRQANELEAGQDSGN
jgi:hypothetical protein